MSDRVVQFLPRSLILVLCGIVAVAEMWVLWLALHPHVDANYRAYYIDQTTTCLDKPTSGSYAIGRTVSFLPDDQAGARKLRVCGWDGPAGDGTHSVGTTSRLRFALDGPVSSLILRLEMTAIVAPAHPVQRVEVAANGVSVGTATIPADTTRLIDFDVPAAAIARDPAHLDVILSFPDAAEMTPHDSITHYRSIKLMSVQLRRPGQPPSAGAVDDPLAQRHHAGPD